MIGKPWNFPGIFILFLALCGSRPTNADIVGTPVRQGGKLVVELSQKIALQRISQTEVATILGSSEQAASLWAAIRTLQLQGGLPTNATDWAELRNIVAKQDLSLDDVVGKFRAAAQSRTVISRTTAATFFAAAPATPQTTVAVSTENPEETFQSYMPKSPTTQRFKDALLASGSRTAMMRIQLLGQLLQRARRTPEVCSARAKDYCASAAPEAVLLWGSEDLDQAGQPAIQFAEDVLAAFPGDEDTFVGKAEITLQGFVAALKMGKTRPTQLQSCLFRGSPSVN